MSSERIRNLIAEELQGLRLRESAIIDEIVSTDRARVEEEEEEDEQAVTADGTNIQVGSRVRIKNKVRRPASASRAHVDRV